MARITDIADALVALLNSSDDVRNIVAVREQSGPVEARDDLRALVVIWPQSEERLIYGRQQHQLTFTLAANVNGIAAAESTYEVDELLTLCDEIKAAVEFQTLSTTAAYIGVSHDPLYDFDLLQTQRKFSANLVFTFREVT